VNDPDGSEASTEYSSLRLVLGISCSKARPACLFEALAISRSSMTALKREALHLSKLDARCVLSSKSLPQSGLVLLLPD
jgi:hypothetical protein